MSEQWNSGIVFAELTDVGMRRANNQDSLACLPTKSEEKFRQRGHLFVVADGMGAHAAGELASRMATERIAMQYFRAASRDVGEALRAAVTDANNEIYQRGQSNPEFHNMGTTASALVLVPAGAVLGHVGDSRVYRLRGGSFEQLTFDHSLVWEMEASGQTGAGIPSNVITRSLGPHPHVEVDVEGPIPIQKGDRFLLCSDGLTGIVDDAEIGALVGCLPEQKALRVLVDLTNLRGGPDNVSIILVRIAELAGESKPVTDDSNNNTTPSSMALPVIAATAGICFLGALLLGLLAMPGPAVVAVLLGFVATIFGVIQWKGSVKAPVTVPLGPAKVGKPAGKAPYRKYDARPTKAMFHRFGETVDELRGAAEKNNWLLDWKKVDEFQQKGRDAIDQQNIKAAIRFQAEAIIETMNQLREQNNRAANETAIDS